MNVTTVARQWPAEGLVRVPYWVYSDRDIYEAEQEHIFRGADLEFPLPRGRVARARQLPPLEPGRDASGGDPRQGGRAARLRESLRAPRLPARARRERRGPQHHLRLSQLELRSRRQPHRRRVPQRPRRQGRHAGGLPAGDAWPAQAARRDARRARLRHVVLGRAAARAISGTRDRRAHPSRDAGAGEAPRRLQPGAAEQLEALHGEREGHLPREPAAHVLHHLPPQPPVAKRRHRGERDGRPSRQLFDRRRYRRQGIRAGRHARRAGRLRARGARVAGIGGRVRRRHRAADPLGVPDLRAAADPQQPRGAPAGAAGTGEDRAGLDLLRFHQRRRSDDRAAPAAGQPDRPGRLHLDGGRRRAGFRPARRRARPPTSSRWSRWAAPASPPTTIASPRPRCAAFGRLTANAWGYEFAQRTAANSHMHDDRAPAQGPGPQRALRGRRSTTTSSKPGRISSSSRGAIASPRRRTSSAGCRSE